MLIEYSVRNYRIIGNECTISMESYDDEHIGDGIAHEPCSGLHILPSAAIYGPNASGKSTILESMSYMRSLVCGPGRDGQGRCTGSGNSDDRMPTAFRIRFFRGHVYEYSLSISNGIISDEVLSSDDSVVFIRDPNGIRIGRHGMNDDDIGRMEDAVSETRTDVPFLSSCVEHGVGCASGAYDWIVGKIIGPGPAHPSPEDVQAIRGILMHADLGRQDIKPADYASDGTMRLASLLGNIVRSLRTGSLLLIDGIERDLHPFIVDRILDMFRGPVSNPNGAQILFTSHDPSVPYRNGMGADQVWLTSADPDGGGTDVRQLLDMMDGTERFEGDYLSGRLGSIPLTRPFWHHIQDP